MSFTWEQLLTIPAGTLLADLNAGGLERANYQYYKIAGNTYIGTTYSDDEMERYCGFMWVVSEGVAEWILTGNVWADDEVNEPPPDVLLPERSFTRYRDIVAYGKQNSDPLYFSDSVWRQCIVTFNDPQHDPLKTEWFCFTYYYRKLAPSEQDYPIAIEFSRAPILLAGSD
jgi:hypothetical protein